MNEILWIVLLFALCSAVVLFAGVKLSQYGDVIAEKTGLGGMWIGVLLMSAVTSLPELVSGVSAIVVFDTPDIAVGDVVGSCMFNLAILAFLDFRHPVPLSARIHQGHILVAAFGLVQLATAALAMVAGTRFPAIGWISLSSLLFVTIHALAMRMMFTAERIRQQTAEPVAFDQRYGEVSVRDAVVFYVVNALLLTSAAMFLPGLGEQLAARTGIEQSFVGSLFLAASTSMPEVVVSVAAARIGAVDMAVGNLFGSNVFNVAILGLDDVLYTRGSLLASVSHAHLVTLVSAMLMTAVAIIGLTYRAQRKRFRLSWEAIAMLVAYFVGLTLLWRLA